MPHTPEPKVSSGQPNIQDVFLNYTRRERLAVSIQLMIGRDARRAASRTSIASP